MEAGADYERDEQSLCLAIVSASLFGVKYFSSLLL